MEADSRESMGEIFLLIQPSIYCRHNQNSEPSPKRLIPQMLMSKMTSMMLRLPIRPVVGDLLLVQKRATLVPKARSRPPAVVKASI
jgi:hypothetical protein